MVGTERLAVLMESTKAEIAGLEAEISRKRAFLEGLEASLAAISGAGKKQPVERGESDSHDFRAPRSGSVVARAFDALKKEGRPMRFDALCDTLGLSGDARKNLRDALRGNIEKGRHFVKEDDDNIGLIIWSEKS